MDRVRIIVLVWVALLAPTENLYSREKHEVFSRTNDFSVFEENGKIGLKDNEGQVLIPAEYDAIGWSNGKLSIVDRVVGYQSEGMWGLINTSNKIVTQAEFLELKPAEGSFLIAQKKSALSQRAAFGVINTSGKTVIPFLYDGLQLANMRAIVMSRSVAKYKFGLVDLSHKVLIPVEYQNIYSLGSLRYAVENTDHKTAIFSDEGNQVTGFTIDSISSFQKDYAIIYQGQKQGLINRSGQMILKPEYREFQIRSDGSIEMRDTNEWYLLTGDNKLLGQCQADEVRALSEERYTLVTSGKYQLTDNAFKPLHEEYFSWVGDFQKGLAVYRRSSRSGVIDENGKGIIPAMYHQLAIDTRGIRACMDIGYKDRWVILDEKGQRLTEKHYEYIGPFNGRFFPVKNRGYWGALNAGGEEIITCVHDSLIQSSGKNIVVKFKGEYGVMDLDENWIVTPRENRIEVLDEKHYFEFAGKTTFLKSFPNNIVYFSENPLAYHGAFIREEMPSGAYWVIDMSGIIIDRSTQPLETELVYPETEGFRAMKKDGKFGFIDNAGRLRVANRYDDARPFSDGLAAIRIKEKWGFIDKYEKLVVQPVYDKVGDFTNGMAIVTSGDLSGLIEASGKLVLPVRFEQIIPNTHNRYILRQGKTFGLADASGSIVIQPRYDAIADHGNGYVIVERGGKFGVLTLFGVSTIPMIYDGLSFDRHHGQFIALKRSAWYPVPKDPVR